MADLPIEDRLAIGDLVTEYAWLLGQALAGGGEPVRDDAVLTIRGREIRRRAGLAVWADHRTANQARRTQHQMTRRPRPPRRQGRGAGAPTSTSWANIAAPPTAGASAAAPW